MQPRPLRMVGLTMARIGQRFMGLALRWSWDWVGGMRWAPLPEQPVQCLLLRPRVIWRNK